MAALRGFGRLALASSRGAAVARPNPCVRSLQQDLLQSHLRSRHLEGLDRRPVASTASGGKDGDGNGKASDSKAAVPGGGGDGAGGQEPRATSEAAGGDSGLTEQGEASSTARAEKSSAAAVAAADAEGEESADASGAAAAASGAADAEHKSRNGAAQEEDQAGDGFEPPREPELRKRMRELRRRMIRDPAGYAWLHFHRVGLPTGRMPGALSSPWGSDEFPQPDSSVLWPSKCLSAQRSMPFTTLQSSGAERAHEHEKQHAEKQVEANRDRLTALWRYSSSHGISWEELDMEFVQWAREGKQAQSDWARRHHVTRRVRAADEKARAMELAIAHVRKYVKDDVEPLDQYPSRTKRLATRIYTKAKKRWFAPWCPGELTKDLKTLVAERMLQREVHERALGLGEQE